jgi:hypothetical protein
MAEPRREVAITDLAKRVADDVTTLAKDHFELARIEITAGVRSAAVLLLGAIVAAVALALLCLTAAVAAEPVVGPLWLRLLLGALLYIAAGGALVWAFARRIREVQHG